MCDRDSECAVRPHAASRASDRPLRHNGRANAAPPVRRRRTSSSELPPVVCASPRGREPNDCRCRCRVRPRRPEPVQTAPGGCTEQDGHERAAGVRRLPGSVGNQQERDCRHRGPRWPRARSRATRGNGVSQIASTMGWAVTSATGSIELGGILARNAATGCGRTLETPAARHGGRATGRAPRRWRQPGHRRSTPNSCPHSTAPEWRARLPVRQRSPLASLTSHSCRCPDLVVSPCETRVAVEVAASQPFDLKDARRFRAIRWGRE